MFCQFAQHTPLSHRFKNRYKQCMDGLTWGTRPGNVLAAKQERFERIADPDRVGEDWPIFTFDWTSRLPRGNIEEMERLRDWAGQVFFSLQ